MNTFKEPPKRKKVIFEVQSSQKRHRRNNERKRKYELNRIPAWKKLSHIQRYYREARESQRPQYETGAL